MTDPKPPRVFPTKPSRHRVEKHIRENIGEAHSRPIDISDQEDKIDPKKFTQDQLYGATRRRVFISHNRVEFKVPEVAGHIIKNWNNKQWLISLLEKYDIKFPIELFRPEILGDFYNIYNYELTNKGQDVLRKILLRFTGLSVKEIRALTDTVLSIAKLPPLFWDGLSDKSQEIIDKSDLYRKSKNRK